MPLDTLANVKSRIGVTSSSDDTLLNTLIDTASAQINSICNRSFNGGTFTEYFDANPLVFQVANWPISTVTSVKVDPTRNFGAETVVPTDRYVVHPERGSIELVGGRLLMPLLGTLVNEDRLDAPRYSRMVQVVYTTSTTVPDEIKQATARLVLYWYQKVKTESAASYQSLSQQRYSDVFVSFQNTNDLGIPVDVLNLLALFRTPVL